MKNTLPFQIALFLVCNIHIPVIIYAMLTADDDFTAKFIFSLVFAAAVLYDVTAWLDRLASKRLAEQRKKLEDLERYQAGLIQKIKDSLPLN